jgi:hypothetical protein
MSDNPLHKAADVLRRHSQAGRKLNDWEVLTPAQRNKWLKKVAIVLEAYRQAQAAKDKAA